MGKTVNYQRFDFQSILTTAKDILTRLRQSVDLLIVAYHGGFERDLQTGLPTESLTGENEAYQLVEEYKDYIDALVTGHTSIVKLLTIFLEFQLFNQAIVVLLLAK